jgi:hypothetical protein
MKSKVHAARDVALEDRVANVPAPDGQALALAVLKIAAAHDRPPRVAGKHPPARLHLVVEVHEASEAGERAEDVHDRIELPRVHVLAVARDVPPAREHQARARTRGVEHRLGRSRRVPLDPPRDQHDQHPSHPATARSMTSGPFVAPGMTVMRPWNASSFPTLRSRHALTTS